MTRKPPLQEAPTLLPPVTGRRGHPRAAGTAGQRTGWPGLAHPGRPTKAQAGDFALGQMGQRGAAVRPDGLGDTSWECSPGRQNGLTPSCPWQARPPASSLVPGATGGGESDLRPMGSGGGKGSPEPPGIHTAMGCGPGSPVVPPGAGALLPGHLTRVDTTRLGGRSC